MTYAAFTGQEIFDMCSDMRRRLQRVLDNYGGHIEN